MKNTPPLLLFCLGLMACAHRAGTATQQTLLTRAAFDLDCAPEALEVVVLDDKSRGVVGCGYRSVYVEVCENQQDLVLRKCTWTANTKRKQRPAVDAPDPDAAAASKLLRRAGFDLECPVSHLKQQPLDSISVGVRGCGQAAVYVERCENVNDLVLKSCTYVLNTHRVEEATLP